MSRRFSILKVLEVTLPIALIAGVIVGPAWAQTSGYRLPWIYCHWQKVLQGWGGSYSHSNAQMWYAYDFSLTEGVPVRAAKSGSVAFVQRGQTECGDSNHRNKANYVTIYHGDGTATLYLHLKDVHVAVGQSVLRGQTIGTAGKTGWTGCTPHLHFQRQKRGDWITDSLSIYFDEYPNQQLQQGSWYQSQNYWPGDRCPTRAEAGLGCGGVIGAGIRKIVRQRKGIRAIITGIVPALLTVGLLSRCTPLGKGDTLLPGNPPVALGPDKPVGVVTPSLVPTAVEPLLPPTPGPVPTPRPLILPSVKKAEEITAHWKVFDDSRLGIRFRYPSDYEIRISPFTDRQIGISIDRPIKDPVWGEGREFFDSMFVFLLEKEDPRLITPEGLEAWVRELPENENPIPGGGPIRVVEKIQIGGCPAFVIQEPLWPGDPPNVQSLIVIGKKRVLWIGLGDTMYLNPERTEKIWPLQMAFLATLEVTK